MFPLHIRALQLCLLAVCPILKILWCWCWIVAFLDNARLFLIFNACYKFIPHRIIPLTARQVAYLGKTWEYFCPGPSLFPAAGRDGSSRMDEKNWSRCWKEHGLKKNQGKMLKLWQITLLLKRLLWLLNARFDGKLSELSIYLLRMFWFIIWTKLKMCFPVISYPTNTVSFFVFKLNWYFANLKLFNMRNELIL